jgi:hypothetical protein
MAASGFTPISLYHTTTPAAVPLNTDLTNGELALNITDGKLYYKDNLGVVTLIADKNNTPTNTFATDITVNSLTIGRGNFNVFTNTALGASALITNTTGSSNTATGYQALRFNNTGSYNTATGEEALHNNTTGANNTATGSRALNRNTTGVYNTATGYEALYFNTTGNQNTAHGFDALYINTTGSNNTAHGMWALQSNTTASGNTAVGHSALKNNNTGPENVAIGYQALTSNTTGEKSVAIGYQALLNATGTGNLNTAVGWRALASNTSGQSNVAIGAGAIGSNTTGRRNVGIGGSALNSVTTGSGNTAISPVDDAGSYAPVFDPTTQDNRFCMGSTAVTNAYIQVAWTVVSDARDKTDFAEVPHGLDFVNKINPIAYRYKATRDATEGHGPVRYGFKAQEVLALEGDNPVIVDAEDSEKLRFNDQSMLAVLVNAINELTAEVNNLKAKLPK